MQMMDIHMHLIPNVDDGSVNMDMSLLMLLRAQEQGIGGIFATSHSSAYDYSPKETREKYRQLCTTAARMFPDIPIYLGCEVYCEPREMSQILENLNSGVYPTMNGTQYVLAEFSQWIMPEMTVPCVQALADAGYIPIIAHMERYQFLRNNMELVNRFRELGARIQINAYSLSGEGDEDIQNWARRLVQEGKVDFLGTDAHRTYHRPPSAEMGLRWLYENVPQEYADAIVWENAQKFLRRRTDNMEKIPMKKNLDKFRGCLIGGAAGDALGYAVEFLSEQSIFNRYGKCGITNYHLHNGKAWISDDTQMTMFTANGLLFGTTRRCTRGMMDTYPSCIAKAYREWYKTQIESYAHCNRKFTTCWLLNVPELFEDRAPGNTCMSAIGQGCGGTVETPINNSKGCGGVMRVAPIGLYFGESPMMPLDIDRMGADAAALTHGHEMGYIPAAMLVHIIRLVSHNEEISLKEAVLDSLNAMEQLFPNATHLPGFRKLMEQAVALAQSDVEDLTAIHQLGEGWVGDEALAIAVYCALKYSHDFDKAILAAVNHRGDSDSTGAIAGNILGAYLGLSRIPRKYLDNLELVDVLTELADDLYYDCPLRGDTPAATVREAAWRKKYVSIQSPND